MPIESKILIGTCLLKYFLVVSCGNPGEDIGGIKGGRSIVQLPCLKAARTFELLSAIYLVRLHRCRL